jgi:hypothetical protein
VSAYHRITIVGILKIYENSVAKWKRDAEGWFRKDSAMLEGLLETVEDNVVRCISLICYGIALMALFNIGKRR